MRFAYEKITFDRCRKVLNFSLPSSFSKQVQTLLLVPSAKFVNQRCNCVVFVRRFACDLCDLGNLVSHSKLLDLLKARISRETVCPGSDLGDAHDQMKDAQESFMASYSRKVRGRENELEQVSALRFVASVGASFVRNFQFS